MFRVLLSFVLSLGVAAAASAQAPAAPGEPFVVLCPITGMIDDGLAVLVERAVAQSEGAAALIFAIDTAGGKVDSAIKITDSILSATCPTIAFVEKMGAISAGALISYSCDEIVMTSSANIGASAVVLMGAGEVSDEVHEKSSSFVRAKYRALGEKKGHNPLLGEAMVDQEIELRGYRAPDGRYLIYKIEEGGSIESVAATPAEGKADAIDFVFDDLERELPVKLDSIKETIRDLTGQAAAPEEAESKEGTVESTVLPDGSELICAAGKLLTLTSQEALRFGLISRTADSVEEVMAEKGWAEMRTVAIEPTWSEALFRWLTSPMISGLLLMLGVGGLYVEIRTPGFGLPGIIGVSCLALFFGSYLVIGLADWVELLFVLVGAGLVVVEVFVLPGFGLAGVLGMLCLFMGVYLALTQVAIPQYSWDFARLGDAGRTVTTATVLMVLLAVASWKFFPKTPFYRWLILSDTQATERGYTVQALEEELAAVGLEGVAGSDLRPAGRGRFENRIYDVVTQGEYIGKGTRIRIIQAEGNRYVVETIPEETQS